MGAAESLKAFVTGCHHAVCGGTDSGVNVRVPEGHAVQGASFSISVQGVPGGEGSNGVSYFITFRW